MSQNLPPASPTPAPSRARHCYQHPLWLLCSSLNVHVHDIRWYCLSALKDCMVFRISLVRKCERCTNCPYGVALRPDSTAFGSWQGRCSIRRVFIKSPGGNSDTRQGWSCSQYCIALGALKFIGGGQGARYSLKYVELMGLHVWDVRWGSVGGFSIIANE